jgi:hypothetical protein
MKVDCEQLLWDALCELHDAATAVLGVHPDDLMPSAEHRLEAAIAMVDRVRTEGVRPPT